MTTEAHSGPEPFLPDEEAEDDEWLRQAMTKRRVPRLTLLLAFVATVAIAFMAGVLVEKNYFTGSSTGGAGGGAAGRFSRFFGRGATGSTGASGSDRLAAAGVTVGQVKVINGKSFYVTDTSGNTLKVVLTPSSTLTAEKTVGYQTLHPGDTVTVRGQATSGTIRATSIAIGSGSGGAGLGGFLGGLGGGGTGGGAANGGSSG
jgi:hypothetical protein